ncbi:MAG: hypothetical protein C5B48_08860 [Candidatus Rokuibacteriota bacterium]|nr:MAG: hypothetical protein C5B48_08860 [Candidatus Rokubacteria bacterium]
MSVFKDHRFPVGARWLGGRLALVSAAGKPDLQVATPPEFRGGIPGVWSPEDLLVAAAASCFLVTLVAIAERRRLPLRDLDVRGIGHVSKRQDASFGFVAVELEADIVTDHGLEEAVEEAADRAESRCLVSSVLDVPLHVVTRVRAPEAAAVA